MWVSIFTHVPILARTNMCVRQLTLVLWLPTLACMFVCMCVCGVRGKGATIKHIETEGTANPPSHSPLALIQQQARAKGRIKLAPITSKTPPPPPPPPRTFSPSSLILSSPPPLSLSSSCRLSPHPWQLVPNTFSLVLARSCLPLCLSSRRRIATKPSQKRSRPFRSREAEDYPRLQELLALLPRRAIPILHYENIHV